MHLNRGDRIKVRVLEGAANAEVNPLKGKVIEGIVRERWTGTGSICFRIVGGSSRDYYIDNLWFSLEKQSSNEPSCI